MQRIVGFPEALLRSPGTGSEAHVARLPLFRPRFAGHFCGERGDHVTPV
jgi:hypothetical protein